MRKTAVTAALAASLLALAACGGSGSTTAPSPGGSGGVAYGTCWYGGWGVVAKQDDAVLPCGGGPYLAAGNPYNALPGDPGGLGAPDCTVPYPHSATWTVWATDASGNADAVCASLEAEVP